MKEIRSFRLPPVISELVEARNNLRARYQAILSQPGSGAQLRFTFDGNLIGDIGEAIAVELFGISLVNVKSTEGIDGFAPDGRCVQVKATGTGRGPVFRNATRHADHLLFFDLNLEALTGCVVFNGPEHIARSMLPKNFTQQRMITPKQIRLADRQVHDADRLPFLDASSTRISKTCQNL